MRGIMLNRRIAIAGFAALALNVTAAAADAWKAKYPELVFAVVPAENASGVNDRYAPFIAYMSKELGTKVTLRIANDYAAVIEGQRAGNIHIAMYGPASYARAYVTGAKVVPFAIEVNGDGTKGYYSVFYVRKASPFRTIEDTHVLAATVGYLAGVARAYGFDRNVLAELVAHAASLTDIGARGPSDPVTHVLLAGVFGSARKLAASLDSEWHHKVTAEERERWLRDMPILLIAENARTKRTENAFATLAKV